MTLLLYLQVHILHVYEIYRLWEPRIHKNKTAQYLVEQVQYETAQY